MNRQKAGWILQLSSRRGLIKFFQLSTQVELRMFSRLFSVGFSVLRSCARLVYSLVRLVKRAQKRCRRAVRLFVRFVFYRVIAVWGVIRRWFRKSVRSCRRSLKVVVKRIKHWKRQVIKRMRRVLSLVRRVPEWVGRTALRFAPPEGRASTIDSLLDDPVVVETPNGSIRFLGVGRLSFGRAQKLMTKEPDSLRWIDQMAPGSVFWDIGANIGTLTLYAARREVLRIWSFEPAAANYFNLVANCELNGYSKQVQCLQLGFGDRVELGSLNVSQLRLGESFSFKHRRKHPDYPGWQAVQLWSIDEFIRYYNVACPNYIKVDVPGLTNEILAGATHTLSRPELKEIQLEVGESRQSGRRIIALLEGYGFNITRRNLRFLKHGITVESGDLVFSRAGISDVRGFGADVRQVDEGV